MLLAMGMMVEGELGMKFISDDGIGELMIFSLLHPCFIPPVPHFWIFVPNFTIHHDDFEVSAFISNPAAAHGTLLAPHRPPIPQDLGMRSLRGEYCYIL